MNDALDPGTSATFSDTCPTVTRCGMWCRFCGLAHFRASENRRHCAQIRNLRTCTQLPRNQRVLRVSSQFLTYNGIDISPITVSTYDKQRKCDITDNGTGICALRHTTVSTYDRMLVCALPHKTVSAYDCMLVCLYAPCRIKRYRHTVLCFCAHKGLLQMRRNSTIRS